MRILRYFGHSSVCLGGLAHDAVIDAQFHPLSDAHVIVLSRDGLRIYDIREGGAVSPCAAWLFPPAALAGSVPVAFAFGAARGWELFAIFILTASGALYYVTPILPPGVLLPAADWHELRADLEAALASPGTINVRSECCRGVGFIFKDAAAYRMALLRPHGSRFDGWKPALT